MRVKLEDIDLPRNVRLMAFQFALNAPVSAALRSWAVPWIKAMADFALAPLPEGEIGKARAAWFGAVWLGCDFLCWSIPRSLLWLVLRLGDGAQMVTKRKQIWKLTLLMC